MTAALFAAGGTGFALGNLLLARLLPESEYGYLSLSLSFVQLGHALGPLGLEIIINRRRLAPSPALLRRAASTSADRKSTRLNSSHCEASRMPSSA